MDNRWRDSGWWTMMDGWWWIWYRGWTLTVMMDDGGWFWRRWTDDGPLPHGGCWWPEEQWALGDHLLLNQNTAILWFTINILCSWNAGSGAKVWFGWITKVVPSCFSDTNSNVFAANLHLFQQQEHMQGVLLLAIYHHSKASDWSPVFNKYKIANSNTNTKMQGGPYLQYPPSKTSDHAIDLLSWTNFISHFLCINLKPEPNEVRWRSMVATSLELVWFFKGKKMYIYVQIFMKYEDWRPLILWLYDSIP